MSEERKPKSIRDGFGEGLLESGKRNKNVVVLSADLTSSVRANYFKKEFPERFYSMGVSEQDMMGTAAGMALSGKIPFACTFSAFAAGRVWEQIRVSLCYQNANVKIGASHGGITVGEDGATHQACEEFTILRSLPRMTILVPADAAEGANAVLAACEHYGPVYIRTTRNSVPYLSKDDDPFIIGKSKMLRDGGDVTIIACGQLVHHALNAAIELEKQGIEARVINMHTIKPIDEDAILAAAKDTGAIVTCEEHTVMGGLGGAVTEVLCKNKPVPVEMIGMQDVFGVSGTPAELIKHFNMDDEAISKAVLKVLKRK